MKSSLQLVTTGLKLVLLSICLVPSSNGQEWAEDVDLSKLPKASKVDTVDFKSQVWPILEAKCLSCHGFNKPKGGYQLTSRENAIESGDYGENILIGKGIESPLLHFAAHAVEDMEMPPIGKGEKMSMPELEIIRAWIDQGVSWEDPYPQTVNLDVTFGARTWQVDGNKSQFRQLHGFREDDSFGLLSFSLYHPKDEGAAWYSEVSIWTHPDEFQFLVGFDQPEGSWFEAGFEQWKSFDSVVGGYAPDFANSSFALPSFLDRTHQDFYFKGGLKQEDGPNISISYQLNTIHGNKALTSFGEAAEDISGNYTLRSIRPSAKFQDNLIHRLDILIDSGESHDYWWENESTIEWMSTDEMRQEYSSFSTNVANAETRTDRRDTWDSIRGANSVRFEKQLPDKWLLSLGHSFSLMEGDSVFTENTIGLTNPFSFQGATAQGIVLNQHSQMGNINLIGGPWDNHITFAAGLQFDWLRQDGEGEVIPFPGAAPQALDTGWDQVRFTELVSVRYTGVQKQVFYSDVRFRQMQYDQSEFYETQLQRMTEADYLRHQFTAGWRYRPNPKLGLHLRSRYIDESTDYSNPLDQKFGAPGIGYPAFLSSRDSDTLELETRLSWAPVRMVRFENHYQFAATDLQVSSDSATDFSGAVITPGGSVDSANFDTHSIGSTIHWTPISRLSGNLHASLTKWDLSSYSNNFSGVSPYQGWSWWIGSRWDWVLNPKTDIYAGYDFSRADFDSGTSGSAFAQGLDYRWHRSKAGIHYHWRENVSTFAEYAYSVWDQPSLGGAQDFEAHGVFVGVNWRLEVEKSKPEQK